MADERGRERADPLSDVVGLVRPQAVVGKEIAGAGRWALRFAGNEAIDFAMVTAGRCHYDGPGGSLMLGTGDFLLLCAPPAGWCNPESYSHAWSSRGDGDSYARAHFRA